VTMGLLGKLDMLKSITRTMLTSAMGFAWDVVRTGERGVVKSEAFETTDIERPYAGFVEKSVWQARRAMVGTGEGLELFVNRFAMRLGYRDGEVSGMVA
jgi:hypothetical protein